MKRIFDIALVTTLGAGFSPIAPGTAGALAGVSAWLIATFCGVNYQHLWLATFICIVIFTILSIGPINRIEKIWGPDPSQVVIDETVGVWICLLSVPESTYPSMANSVSDWSAAFLLWVAAAFVLFRFFDILKPLGIRKMERYPGGWGVMADDILSGVYGLIILSVTQLFV